MGDLESGDVEEQKFADMGLASELDEWPDRVTN